MVKTKWKDYSKRFRILYIIFVSFMIFLIVMAIKWNITGEIKIFDKWSVEFQEYMNKFWSIIGGVIVEFLYVFIVKPIALVFLFIIDVMVFIFYTGLGVPIVAMLLGLMIYNHYNQKGRTKYRYCPECNHKSVIYCKSIDLGACQKCNTVFSKKPKVRNPLTPIMFLLFWLLSCLVLVCFGVLSQNKVFSYISLIGFIVWHFIVCCCLVSTIEVPENNKESDKSD